MSALPTTTTFRDMAYALSPAWLRGWAGSRFMYSMAVELDAIGDGVAYAVRARFPNLAPSDAPPFIASDRQIVQGFSETTSSWLGRTVEWLDRHAHRGSPWGFLMAIRACFSPDTSAVACITNRNTWDSYAAGNLGDLVDVPPTHAYVSPHGDFFDWDSASGFQLRNTKAGSCRMWVVIYPDAALAAKTTQVWGDGSKWGTGAAWGVKTMTPTQTLALRAAVGLWKAANTWCPTIILSWDPLGFTSSAASTIQPDGTWGTWAKVTPTGNGGRPQYVESRSGNAAYLEGIA